MVLMAATVFLSGCDIDPPDPALLAKVEALEQSHARLVLQVSNLTARVSQARETEEMQAVRLAAAIDDLRRIQDTMSQAERLHALHEQAIDTIANGTAETVQRLDSAMQMINQVSDSLAALQQSVLAP